MGVGRVNGGGLHEPGPRELAGLPGGEVAALTESPAPCARRRELAR
jgi:hypothetical protein